MNIRVYAKGAFSEKLLIGEIYREDTPPTGQMCTLVDGVTLPVESMVCHGAYGDDPCLTFVVHSETDFNLLQQAGFEDHTPGSRL